MPRDQKQIDKRNDALLKRYKTLYDVKRTRHDDVIRKLSDEFYLTAETVNKIVRNFKGA
jgi:Sec7-like guanine-nucleotide exchange factor